MHAVPVIFKSSRLSGCIRTWTNRSAWAGHQTNNRKTFMHNIGLHRRIGKYVSLNMPTCTCKPQIHRPIHMHAIVGLCRPAYIDRLTWFELNHNGDWESRRIATTDCSLTFSTKLMLTFKLSTFAQCHQNVFPLVYIIDTANDSDSESNIWGHNHSDCSNHVIHKLKRLQRCRIGIV